MGTDQGLLQGPGQGQDGEKLVQMNRVARFGFFGGRHG